MKQNKSLYEKLDFDDILIEPNEKTFINSRNEIDVFYDYENYGSLSKLPIITSPVKNIVSQKNLSKFISLGINICLPKGEIINLNQTESSFLSLSNIMIFQSFSLIDFTEKYIFQKAKHYPKYVLIDILNGHMSDLLFVTKKAKEFYGSTMILMVGKISNPETYKLLSEAGADYVRCGIGGDDDYTNTNEIGIGYPIASLIIDCYQKSLSLNKPAKIVADGHINKQSDIIKALGLGADYVMLNSVLKETVDSYEKKYWLKIPINKSLSKFLYRKKFKLKIKKNKSLYKNIEYNLEEWVEKFLINLKTVMSFTNSKNLEDFIGKVNFNKIIKK